MGKIISFIDNDSVEKDDYTAKVWVKLNYPDGTCYEYRIKVDHYNRTTEMLEFVKYDSDGNVIANGEVSSEAQKIVPGSNGELLYHSIWAR